MNRSWLFVPGDRPERMEKALGLGADVLILDLEDAVAADRKEQARTEVVAFVARAPQDILLYVRINPLDGPLAQDDLAALARSRPMGVVLPKCVGPETVRQLDALAEHHDVTVRDILPIATEIPAAIFTLGTYGLVAPRLAGLTWGAEDLPTAIGATTAREPDGRFTAPYEMVRALALFGAHAAGAPAIETVYPDFKDLDGLSAYAARAARDGFSGMLAIHPSQVPVINAAFAPSAAAVASARQVVEIFAANPGVGSLSLDGRMVDRPHLVQAKAILAKAARVP